MVMEPHTSMMKKPLVPLGRGKIKRECKGGQEPARNGWKNMGKRLRFDKGRGRKV